MNKIDNKQITSKTIILVEYEKEFPPEHFIKKRGRKPSVTKYTLNKDKIVSAKKVKVDRIAVGRDVVDIDNKKMVTRVYYRDENGKSGIIKYEESPDYLEILPGIYIHSSLEHLIDQILTYINE